MLEIQCVAVSGKKDELNEEKKRGRNRMKMGLTAQTSSLY
jgi:hypothetical protein